MNYFKPCSSPKGTRPRTRYAHPQRFIAAIPRPICINRSRQARRERSQRAAPAIPRRSASSKRLFASASRCEKPYLFLWLEWSADRRVRSQVSSRKPHLQNKLSLSIVAASGLVQNKGFSGNSTDDERALTVKVYEPAPQVVVSGSAEAAVAKQFQPMRMELPCQ